MSGPDDRYEYAQAAALAAQQALTDSQEQYRLLAENASDMVWRLDNAGIIRWCSPSTQSSLGWRPEQLEGTVALDLVHADDRPGLIAWREQIIEGKHLPPFEARARTADGEYRWTSFRSTRTTDLLGEATGRVIGLRDIHAMVATRQALDTERQLLHATLDSLLDPHVLMEAVRDDSGRIVDFIYLQANDAACAFNRLARGELIGRRLLDVVSELERDKLLARCAQVVETGEPLVLDEVPFSDEARGHPLGYYDMRGTRLADGLTLTWRDVTSRREAAQAVAESERQFRLLAENASDLVAQADLNAVLQWFSPSIASLGWAAEDVVGHRATEFIHPDDWPLLTQAGKATADGESATVEWRVRAKHGAYRWFRVNVRPILAPDGAASGWVSGWQDIEAQRASRVALARSEKYYRLLADNASDVVFRTSPQGVFEWISPSVSAVLGWNPRDMVGSPPDTFIHPDDLRLLQRARRQAGAGQPSWPEVRLRRANGTYRWMSTTAKPVFTPEGTVIAHIGSARDVTTEHEARDALSAAEYLYELVAENATDAVFMISNNDVITWASPAAERVLGYRARDMVGTSTADLTHPDDRELQQETIRQVQQEREVVETTIRVRTKSGQYRWMSAVSSHALDRDGVVVGRIATLRDIDEQVSDQRALARSEQTLRLVMDSAPQGIAVVGFDGRFERVNASLCALLGRNTDWMAEHTETDVIHPQDVQSAERSRDLLLAGDADHDTREVRVLTATGMVRAIQRSTALIRDNNGSPLYFVSQYRDITDAPQTVLRQQDDAPNSGTDDRS
ncbi:MAG: PAS domain S-box protein [Actinomycetes bacterium]